MKKFILFSAVFIFLAGLVWGQTYTWTGDGLSGDWTDPDNWDGGASPGDGDPSYIIIIGPSSNDPVFSSMGLTGLECDTLTIESGASLNMGAFNLTVDTLENNGNLILDGSGSQTVNITSTVANETVTYDAAGGTHFAGLTDFNNLVIVNGTRTGVGAITVGGNFTLAGGSLNATSIDVEEESNFIGDVTTTGGTQTYSGNVNYSGNRTLTGSTVNLGHIINGVGGALTINGNGVLHGGSGIGALTVTGDFTLTGGPLTAGSISVTGTSSIGENVSTTGDQAYGAVTLTGTRTLTSTGGNITATGTVSGTGITVNASHGISLANAANALSGTVTLNNTQPGTPTGDITFTNVSAAINLAADNNAANGKINIKQTGSLSIGSLQTDSGGEISIEASGAVTQTGAITTDSLTVETNAVITLGGNNVVNTVNLKSNAVSPAQGSITYNNNVGASNTLEVTAATAGNVSITETTGSLDVDSIASGADINLTAHTDIETKGINVSGKVTLNAGGDITVSDGINAHQLTATANGAGIVTVNTVNIDSSNTGSEGINAAIYIKAADFVVTSVTPSSIVPGGSGGQLCLDLKQRWDDLTPVVDGIENVRWHQHFINLTNMHLIYGTLPAIFNPLPPGYVHIQANDVKTSFTLDSGYNVYINDAVNTNASGISFKTTGAGFIEFSGTNKFEKITLETAVGGGIKLVDTDITITEGFKLTHGEGTALAANSPPGTGSSIKAAEITLNNITAAGGESLTLTTTTGNIISGNAGLTGAYLGDVTVNSADKVTISGAVYANSITVTSTGTTINADITTTGNQTYTGAVTLGNNVGLTGTTITLGTITGAAHSLTITGNSVLNGAGSGINVLSVNGTTTISANITTTGAQTYNGAVTLVGTGATRTLNSGSATVTLGAITGNGNSLNITGNGVLNGVSGINVLSVSGTTTIGADITTTGNQTYTGAVTLGGNIELKTNAGSAVRFSNTLNGTGVARNLTITNADVVFNGTVGSAVSLIENINVTAGKTTINANITTTEDQTYTGKVTLGGNVTLKGTTVTLGVITGAGHSLTITGDGVLNGGSGISTLSVTGNFNLISDELETATISITGTSSINEDITTTGAQTYTGAAILVGSKRTISSQNGAISFGILNSLDEIELLATGTGGNITLGGATTAKQLIAIASGSVSTGAISVSSNGTEGTSAAIYIEADDFTPTTSTANSIVPGISGQLCLVLSAAWADTNNIVAGARWHQHTKVDLSAKHLIYGRVDPDPGDGSDVTVGSVTIPSPYVYVSDTSAQTTFVLDAAYNVYIYDASNTSSLTFETKGTGNIYLFVENNTNNTFEKITLKTAAAGKIIIETDIVTTGTQTYSGTVTLDDNVELKGTTVTLGTITGGGKSLTITGNGVLNGGNSISVLSVSGNTTINQGITTTGAQNYKAVTIGNTLTLAAGTSTVTFDGAIAGGNNSLTITGNGTFNGAVSGINNLSVSLASNINADITTTGNQTYTGAVTLGGDVELKTNAGSTVRFNNTLNGTGAARDLTITDADVVFNGTVGSAAPLIENINVTAGTTTINADITTTGNQTYEGAVTLSSSLRTITSQGGNIEFNSTLTFTGGVIKLSAVNITISGSTNARQLIAKAPSGIVSVNAVTISTNTGNEGENAAIYIEANTFVVTTTAANSIVPGGTGGQLCLKLSNTWTDTYKVVDGLENVRWHQHLPSGTGKILYSFTEDSNGNGRLDRIRVQTDVPLTGDFSNFAVSVDGYEVIKCDFIVTENDSFYIILTEKQEFDGGNTPLWRVVRNTTLKSNAGSIVGNPAVDINIKPIDTIPPRIAYTLTIPGYPQTYVQMSEPVVNSSGLNISASFGSLSVQITGQVQSAGLGYLFNLTSSFKIEDLYNLAFVSSSLVNGYFRMDNIKDKGSPPSVIDSGHPPKYPLNWGYTAYGSGSTAKQPPYELLTADMMEKIAQNNGASVTPNPGNPVIRRVTDVLVSRAPEKTNSDNYFTWPVWARFKKPINVPYAAGNDVFWGQQPTDNGIIWQFDGKSYLETSFIVSNEGLEIQARINDNLPGDPEIFWTISDIPAKYRNPHEASEERKTGGLWLPVVPGLLVSYNYVPLSGGINRKGFDSFSSKLFNYDIAANSLIIASNAKFEFVFRLSSGASDMFVARLDIPRGGAIPANWYTLLRPFIFDIRNIRRQRGGVTIMNNVINSNNREITYIRYHLLRPGRVTVQIYTLDGTLVKSLRRNEQREAGEWTDTWDGTNNGGRAVARGMYFVRVVGPDIDEIRKIMVVK